MSLSTDYLKKIDNILSRFETEKVFFVTDLLTIAEINSAFDKLRKFNTEAIAVYYHLSILEGEYYLSREAQSLLDSIAAKTLNASASLKQYIGKIDDRKDKAIAALDETFAKEKTNIQNTGQPENITHDNTGSAEAAIEQDAAANEKPQDDVGKPGNTNDSTAEEGKIIGRAMALTVDCQSLIKLLDSYTKYNRQYQHLVNRIEARLNLTDRQNTWFDSELDRSLDKLWDDLTDTDGQPSVSTEQRYSQNFYFFLINVKLALLDEGYDGYEAGRSAINKLIFYADLLRSFEMKSFTGAQQLVLKILNYKCRFLLLKILMRLQKDSLQKDKNYILNTPTRDFNYSAMETATLAEVGSQIGPFVDFYVTAKDHYQCPEKYFDEHTTRLKIQEIKNWIEDELQHKKIRLVHVHLFCKYYKKNIDKVSGSWFNDGLNTLDNLKAVFVNRCNTNPPRTSVFPYETAVRLIDAVIFDIKIEMEKKKVRDVLSLSAAFDTAEILFNAGSRDSMGAHAPSIAGIQILRTYIDCVKFLMDKFSGYLYILKNDPVSGKPEDRPNLPDIFQKIITKYYQLSSEQAKLIRQSREEGYLHVYMDLGDCIVPTTAVDILKQPDELSEPLELTKAEGDPLYGIAEVKLFMDSAYVLPSNYRFLLNDLREKDNDVYKLEGKISTNLVEQKMKSSDDDVKTVLTEKAGELETAFDTKVKETQTSTVQLVGFFIGIIVFMLSSVSVVPKFEGGNTVQIVFLFMFLLAGCLTLFTLVIAYITRPYAGRGKNKDQTLQEHSIMDEWRESSRFKAIFIISAIMIVVSFGAIALLAKTNSSATNTKAVETTQPK